MLPVEEVDISAIKYRPQVVKGLISIALSLYSRNLARIWWILLVIFLLILFFFNRSSSHDGIDAEAFCMADRAAVVGGYHILSSEAIE